MRRQIEIDPEFLAELRRKHTKKVQDKKPWGRSKKPPDPVLKVMEEQSKLLREARARRAHRFAHAMKSHGAFRRLIASLKVNRHEATSPYPGVVDSDLPGLIEALGLPALPESSRVLALEEIDKFICDVSRETHGTADEHLPWMLPAGMCLSLTEAREALRLR